MNENEVPLFKTIIALLIHRSMSHYLSAFCVCVERELNGILSLRSVRIVNSDIMIEYQTCSYQVYVKISMNLFDISLQLVCILEFDVK